MLRPVLLALTIAGGAAQPAFAQPAPAAPAQAAAAQQVFVAAYRKGPKYDASKGLVQQTGVAEHIAHIRSIAPSVIGASPVESGGDDLLGYVIFTARDRAAAQAWLSADPAVRAGSMKGDLHRWGVPRVNAWQGAPAAAPR